MRRYSILGALLLALALLLPTVASAGYQIPITFYVTAVNPPANTAIWAADWRQVSIGPLAFGQIAKVKAPSSGDPALPGSGRFFLCGLSGHGTWSYEGTCLSIFEGTLGMRYQSWSAKSGYLYTWDATAGTLTGVPATTKQKAAAITQPLPQIMITLSVANATGYAWGWNVATPVGEWCLSAKVRLPFSSVQTLTMPRVCALAIWKFSSVNAYQVHWFDLSCLENGAHYIYDYATFRLNKA